ncbi:aldehyde dehydrogenase family protein [Ketobacter sp. MCCC 1A13808]|uniref:aldehyde dehydrogenase family protein n=1 Tax=Ketobacter sp. MCCC 1A13808 TaxID=2602738 RepID=UPI000F2B7FAC|nr:aldehyde dehydrogenase family protein [Ketobacter sp. MCCC 1A13808]MVF12620.1 aldehyde dehydrogenase family protein [Ketobacter sp. MCCC 1A13808]RLP55581.1 MAG: aldehyde dehydrogenase family protein [Ketobacter sp.]
MTAPQAINEPGLTIAYNPGTGEEIGHIPNTDLTRLPEMFSHARAAQKIWARRSFKERAHALRLMRDYIVENAEELTEIVSKSNGKTRVDALATEVLPCTLACDWYGKHAEKALQEKKLPIDSLLFINKRTVIQRKPVGVVGIISPWNYPLSIPFGEVIMGLMAGNAIILKVAAATPLVGEAIEKIITAGNLPKGLFQQIVGSGGAVSRAFFAHGIDKIFFTGSVAVGKQLMEQAAKTLTPLSLELGGNDPMLVFEDADLERATNGALWAGFQNAGQSCGGVERVYVHESVYDPFMALMKSKTEALRHGMGQQFDVDIGSLTTLGQLNTVKQHLEEALSKGAEIVAQSKAVGAQDGFFHPATLLANTNNDMLIIKEETFGPVIPVMKFATEEEAIAQANESDLALTSSIWTKDLARGRRIAAELESGVTTINDHLYTHGLSEMPWGGWKHSGLGRTHGHEGLQEMTHVKAVNWDILPVKRNLWWYPFDETTYNTLLNAQRMMYPRDAKEFVGSALGAAPQMVKKMFTKWKHK